jgi:hypothetical protein
MKTHTFKLLFTGILLGIMPSLVAAQQAAQDNVIEEEITVIQKQPEARVPQTFGSSQIRGWYAPDNKTLVIETSRGDFIGTFMNRCSGIRFAEDIGLSSWGPNELDQYTTIVLPDGQRCFFSDLKAYTKDQTEN